MPALSRRPGAFGRLATAALLAAHLGCAGEETEVPAPCPQDVGVICTWAGTGQAGFNGDGKPASESMLYWPMDVGFGPAGVYLVDWNNHRIRLAGGDGLLQTVVGTDFVGDGDPEELDRWSENGAKGTTVNLNHPTDVLFMEKSGLLLVASWHNHKIRQLQPDSGQVNLFAGTVPGFAGDGGPVRDSLLNQPSKLALDPEGNVYILDQRNHRVRKVTRQTGLIQTIAGTGTKGFSGDGGPALDAQLAFEDGPNPEPTGALAIDSKGNLYLADSVNQRIRKIELSTGTITTIAGTGAAGFSGDGGPALEATFNSPRDLALDGDTRLYVADTDNHAVRLIDLEAGSIRTVAGTGERGFSGDGAQAGGAQLARPHGVAVDASGTLYVSDTFNHRVRRIRLR